MVAIGLGNWPGTSTGEQFALSGHYGVLNPEVTSQCSNSQNFPNFTMSATSDMHLAACSWSQTESSAGMIPSSTAVWCRSQLPQRHQSGNMQQDPVMHMIALALPCGGSSCYGCSAAARLAWLLFGNRCCMHASRTCIDSTAVHTMVVYSSAIYVYTSLRTDCSCTQHRSSMPFSYARVHRPQRVDTSYAS